MMVPCPECKMLVQCNVPKDAEETQVRTWRHRSPITLATCAGSRQMVPKAQAISPPDPPAGMGSPLTRCAACWEDKGWCAPCGQQLTVGGLHLHIRMKHPGSPRHLACLGQARLL